MNPARGDDPLRVPTGASERDVLIPRSEVQLEFARSGGPGGQNVNKVETKVVLRFDVRASTAFDEAQRERVLAKLGSRLTNAGELVLHASQHRLRKRNIEDACERLVRTLESALHRAKPRKPTRPSRGAKERRLQDKRKRSDTKRERRRDPE